MLLTDASWWARKAAGGALLRLGDAGTRALRDMAAGSADPYAREMASRVLADAGIAEHRPITAEAI